MEKHFSKELYGYRRGPLYIGSSPYELMYGKPPRLVSFYNTVGHDTPIDGRVSENYCTLVVRV